MVTEEAWLKTFGGGRELYRMLFEDGAGLHGDIVDLQELLEERLRSGLFGAFIALSQRDEILEPVVEARLPVTLGAERLFATFHRGET